MKIRTRTVRFWPAYVAGFASILGLAALAGAIARPPVVTAQIPDSGAQRLKMIREQQLTNQNLAQIIQLLGKIRDNQMADSTTQSSKKVKPSVRNP